MLDTDGGSHDDRTLTLWKKTSLHRHFDSLLQVLTNLELSQHFVTHSVKFVSYPVGNNRISLLLPGKGMAEEHHTQFRKQATRTK